MLLICIAFELVVSSLTLSSPYHHHNARVPVHSGIGAGFHLVGDRTGSDTGGAVVIKPPPFKLMIFISIKMNGSYYAKCIKL